LGGRGRRISEFEASLVYRVSSRTARAIQRNPVSKNQNQNQEQKQKQKKNQPASQTNKNYVVKEGEEGVNREIEMGLILQEGQCFIECRQEVDAGLEVVIRSV
jgi:DNA-nicking Smr family endonuclease